MWCSEWTKKKWCLPNRHTWTCSPQWSRSSCPGRNQTGWFEGLTVLEPPPRPEQAGLWWPWGVGGLEPHPTNYSIQIPEQLSDGDGGGGSTGRTEDLVDLWCLFKRTSFCLAVVCVYCVYIVFILCCLCCPSRTSSGLPPRLPQRRIVS